MKGAFLCSLFMVLLFVVGIEALNSPRQGISSDNTPGNLSPNDDAFNIMMQVVMSPRCMNCHPSGDRPTQGDDMHQHYFNVQRGPDDHGAGTMQCQTCHQDKNNDYTGVPGVKDWHIAPRSMGWQGLDKYQVAKKMVNPTLNGGLDLEALAKHLTEDELVLWAFNPGVNQLGQQRTPPPVTKEDYIKAVKEWVLQGAQIPKTSE